jgi:3-deoxy-D-manno-octulosonic-acid transferase
MYKFATVVFVGKTLTSHGGQNPIEPAAVGKPIVFGPNMENFEQIAHALLAAGAAIQVCNKTELESAIRMLLNDSDKRAEIGLAARNVVIANQGASLKTAQAIAAFLAPRLSVQHN